jgi:hypothetical protein
MKEIKLNPIGVRLTRAERRGRKIILVIESDLYSDETFATTPFYDEGDEKNQLQSIVFNLSVTEKSGKVEAHVDFGDCLYMCTKGHSQLHEPLKNHFLTKKECALDWFMNEKEKYYTDESINKILKRWETDKEFHDCLLNISLKRKKQFKLDALKRAKENYQIALKKLDDCLAEELC